VFCTVKILRAALSYGDAKQAPMPTWLTALAVRVLDRYRRWSDYPKRTSFFRSSPTKGPILHALCEGWGRDDRTSNWPTLTRRRCHVPLSTGNAVCNSGNRLLILLLLQFLKIHLQL
jgi:hypothetical protein